MANDTYLPTLAQDHNFLGYALSPFTALLGDYFYLILLFIPIGMIYLKSQDTAPALVISLLLVGAFGLMVPDEAAIIILALLGVGVATIAHKTFIRSERT